VEAVKFLWKRKHFLIKKLEAEANSKAFDFWGAGSIFHNTRGRDVETEAVEAVKFVGKRKHFEERSWK